MMIDDDDVGDYDKTTTKAKTTTRKTTITKTTIAKTTRTKTTNNVNFLERFGYFYVGGIFCTFQE